MNWVSCRECGIDFELEDWSDGCEGHLCEECRSIIYGDDLPAED